MESHCCIFLSSLLSWKTSFLIFLFFSFSSSSFSGFLRLYHDFRFVQFAFYFSGDFFCYVYFHLLWLSYDLLNYCRPFVDVDSLFLWLFTGITRLFGISSWCMPSVYVGFLCSTCLPPLQPFPFFILFSAFFVLSSSFIPLLPFFLYPSSPPPTIFAASLLPPLLSSWPGSIGTREGVIQKNLCGLLPVRDLRLDPSLLYSLPLLALSPNLLVVWIFLSVAYFLAKLRCWKRRIGDIAHVQRLWGRLGNTPNCLSWVFLNLCHCPVRVCVWNPCTLILYSIYQLSHTDRKGLTHLTPRISAARHAFFYVSLLFSRFLFLCSALSLHHSLDMFIKGWKKRSTKRFFEGYPRLWRTAPSHGQILCWDIV